MRSRENPNNQRNKRQRKKAAAPAIPTKTKDKKYSVVVNFSAIAVGLEGKRPADVGGVCSVQGLWIISSGRVTAGGLSA
jgi:hypothetical protein